MHVSRARRARRMKKLFALISLLLTVGTAVKTFRSIVGRPERDRLAGPR